MPARAAFCLKRQKTRNNNAVAVILGAVIPIKMGYGWFKIVILNYV